MSSKDYFDEIAVQWDTMQKSFFSNEVRDAAFLRAGVIAGQLAADIGAGSGFITTGLVAHGLRVIAVDQSEQMLAQIRQKFAVHPGIEYRRGDADALPIKSACWIMLLPTCTYITWKTLLRQFARWCVRSNRAAC